MPYNHHLSRNALPGVLDNIKKAIYLPVAHLRTRVWTSPEPLPFERRLEGAGRELSTGQSWGKLWDCGWFRFEGTVPENAAGREVVLRIDISGEALAVDADGTPIRGLTTYASEFDRSLGRPGKTELPFLEKARGGETVDLWCDGACNDLFGKYPDSGSLKLAEIAVVNPGLRSLYYDFEVLHDLMLQLPETGARHHRILAALLRAASALDKYTDPEAVVASDILAPELAAKAGDTGLSLSAVGHAHIDLAWLWPIRETIRKGARTFSTALANLRRYPGYVFGASQPQLYQWVKDHYPRLYANIAPFVKSGRWETQGAMWVEPDTNLAGGESLVRQLLYGLRFFKEEFGTRPRMLWLPDVFGYSGALPQILKKSGIEWFMTTKLSWNKFNKMPHHTFNWKGIDGSAVLAHMAPEGTYNSSALPRAVAAAEREYLDKAVADKALLIYGIGDGGGGPGEEHLERLNRQKNLSGLVPVRQEPAETFFERLQLKAESYREWAGELYFEMHQGTYTTQARNKAWNRRIEGMLREAEFAATLAMLKGSAYPFLELEEVWKEVLLYQFHDILPGSSIGRVYEESLARYEALGARLHTLTEKNLGATSLCPDTGGHGGQDSERNTDLHQENPVPMALNVLSWDRKEWVRYDGQWLLAEQPALSYAPVQSLGSMPGGERVSASDIFAGTGSCVTGTGTGVVGNTNAPSNVDRAMLQDSILLKNDLVTLRVSNTGGLISLADNETGFEYLDTAQGEGNRLEVWKDDGDAWDFPVAYRDRAPERFVLQSATVLSDGPRSIFRASYGYGSSIVEQDLILTTGSRRVDFVTRVDWRDRGRMLRAAFPTNLKTRDVECEIQFGSINRPSHENTSWDAARYEICAHRWINLDGGDAGIALINDCKYGHFVREGLMELTLLRSPGYPDPEADKGLHSFTYALYPHRGSADRVDLARRAHELNMPLKLFRDETPAARARTQPLFTVSDGRVLVESVKAAEDGNGVVLRLYESTGSLVRGLRISAGFAAARIELVDLMEENPWMLSVSEDGGLLLDMKPYEIVTLRFLPKS